MDHSSGYRNPKDDWTISSQYTYRFTGRQGECRRPLVERCRQLYLLSSPRQLQDQRRQKNHHRHLANQGLTVFLIHVHTSSQQNPGAPYFISVDGRPTPRHEELEIIGLYNFI
ncbi:hypothetical protein RF11_14708 [Thelohanellus kitauei]|uniref:Uncharacterized protein n=1 Tax=Thelohanellus kitauei TaxID=669202 RepID=A0A0C2MAA9_THEKT|nr:hypothetical protein RF11_14708 [Thelohanellus kitauei]